jgi:hypothetical protein
VLGKIGCGVVGKCSITRIGCTESEAEEAAWYATISIVKGGNRAWVPQNLSVLKNQVGKKRQARKATSLSKRKQCLIKRKQSITRNWGVEGGRRESWRS